MTHIIRKLAVVFLGEIPQALFERALNVDLYVFVALHLEDVCAIS